MAVVRLVHVFIIVFKVPNLRRSRQIRERKALFFFLLLLLGNLGGLSWNLPCALKIGFVQRKLFFKFGASRENFSSTVNGCINKSFSVTEIT